MMMMKILNQYTTHSSAETSFLLVVYSIAAESRNTCTSTLVVIRVHCQKGKLSFLLHEVGGETFAVAMFCNEHFPCIFFIFSARQHKLLPMSYLPPP